MKKHKKVTQTRPRDLSLNFQALVFTFFLLFLAVVATNAKADTLNSTVLTKGLEISSPEITLTVPEVFMPDTADQWDTIDAQLRSDNLPKTITFDIQGFGGDVVMLTKFIGAVQYARAHGHIVKMNVIGPAYSAHAFMTCYADSLTLQPEGSLMFHQAKTSETLFAVPFVFSGIDLETPMTDPNALALERAILAQCAKKGLLTPQDVYNILMDNEVVIIHGPDGVSLVKETHPNPVGTLSSVYSGAESVLELATLLIVLILIRRALHHKS